MRDWIVIGACFTFLAVMVCVNAYFYYHCFHCKSAWALRYWSYHNDGTGTAPEGTVYMRRCIHCKIVEEYKLILVAGNSGGWVKQNYLLD